MWHFFKRLIQQKPLKESMPPAFVIQNKNCFTQAIQSANKLLATRYYAVENKIEERSKTYIEALNFMIDVVRKDLVSSWNASVIIYNDDRVFNKIQPFPLLDDMRVGDQTISLQTDMIVMTWRHESILGAAYWLKDEDFEFQESNHFGYYFKGLDLCIMYNGLHSVAYSTYDKKIGYLNVQAFDVSVLFESIYTDGEYWYDRKTKQRLRDSYDREYPPVCDTRFAILFALCQIQYHVKTEDSLIPDEYRLNT